MNTETRVCQNCKHEFLVEPDDFQFYKKINVPPPTWCPKCRQMRRYSWRNERVLYRRDCDLCGKSTVTIYSPNKPFKVYCPPCWWSDKWTALDFGRGYDFSRPFFEQFKELQLEVPRIALLTKNSVNSEYTNHSGDNKNCYLNFSTFDSENIMYSNNIWKHSQDCCDCYRIPERGTLLYECADSERCYRCQYSMLLKDCTNCFYCYDCRGCSDCFLSSNLRNKKYYFMNTPHSKDDYLKKISEYRLNSFTDRLKLYDQYLDLIKNKALHRFASIEKSNDVSGNMILNSKNCHYVFDANDAEDTKYAIICPDVKNTMDSYHYGFACEIIYECHALVRCYNVLFTHLSYDNAHLQYCDSCHNSENLFGCVGVKQGRYCILNKRYGETEYEELKERIIAHMRSTKEYGEFFPAQLSPFGYNETQGQIYMPLTKEELEKRGWKWEDRVPGMFGRETIKPEEVPDSIDDVGDSIIKEALACTKCGRNYNVIKPELDFYRREKIPIPRKCPPCRYIERMSLRPPRKLWYRACQCTGRKSQMSNTNFQYQNTAKHLHGDQPCPNEFETSYAPERPEIVYCESCYNSEVA